jgi:hypothetical protein
MTLGIAIIVKEKTGFISYFKSSIYQHKSIHLTPTQNHAEILGIGINKRTASSAVLIAL